MHQRCCALAALILLASSPGRADEEERDRGEWRERLRTLLPKMGHRNWIVVADSAYPSQTAQGIETIVTGEEHLKVLRQVVAELGKQRHVRPVVYLDKELAFVPENHARGIENFRQRLYEVLDERAAHTLPHEEIIARLDKAGNTFHVLVLKTNVTLPYTSVFFELDCGYWGAEGEKALRDAMKTSDSEKLPK
jgi:L-fucose mutarotase/ribose pyranase (RbsD/FucU family)